MGNREKKFQSNYQMKAENLAKETKNKNKEQQFKSREDKNVEEEEEHCPNHSYKMIQDQILSMRAYAQTKKNKCFILNTATKTICHTKKTLTHK